MAHDPMSDDELDEIARRVADASKGPWESFIEGRDQLGGDSFIRIGGLDDAEPDMYVTRDLTPAVTTDLDFIAHARQDIPRLLAEVHRLRDR